MPAQGVIAMDMITMVNVSNMDRSVAFYRDTLGLHLRFQSPGWSEFDVGGSTVALHGADKTAATSGGCEVCAGTVSLGFTVENVDRTAEELKSKHVRFVMEPADRQGEGIRLAVFLDPDGLAISIAHQIAQAQHP